MGDTPEIHTKTRLVLEKRHQLIDLNKEYVNFEIFFECRSADATKDFEMLVINQEQLNTIDLTNLVMKKTKGGYISGNIIADEDKYQNYFLVIRAIQEDESHDVDLDITLKPIPPNTEKMNTIAPPPPSQPIPPQSIPTTTTTDGGNSRKGCENKMTMYILIAVLGVIVLVIFAYIFYTRYYCSAANKDTRHELLNNDDGFSDTTSSSSEVSNISKAKSKGSASSGTGILANLIKNKSSKESKGKEKE